MKVFILIAFLFAIGGGAWSIAQSNPFFGSEPKYMGSNSCGTSNCHGNSAAQAKINILGNEFTRWVQNDAHSRAFKTLTEDAGQRIAFHLGIKNPEASPRCLICHATETNNATGPRFRIEDGIQCETCHGPAEKYLKNHANKNLTFTERVALGMKDLRDPGIRAEFCSTCHQINSKNGVDHELYGAGHPRLAFELDTFTAIQPAHWKVDQDYLERKGPYYPAQAWFAGQVLRAKNELDHILKMQREPAEERFKSFSIYQCYSCHHDLQAQQFLHFDYEKKPGRPRLNLISVSNVASALRTLNPKIGTALAEASPQNASKIIRDLDENDYRAQLVNPAVLKSILKNILVLKGYVGFERAEQIAMASSALTSQLDPERKIFAKQIDEIYKATESIERFNPILFQKVVERISQSL